MTKFYNPYHFIPTPSGQRSGDLPVEAFNNKNLGNSSHAKYVYGTHSGRIICKIKTEGPVFVGGERVSNGDENHPSVVSPFQLGGKPAIPGTSLRGLISSLAEAASNSAMRALENRTLSYRKPMRGGSISAIGRIIKDNDKYYLHPLVLPTVEADRNYNIFVKPQYRQLFDAPRLKIYFGNRDDIRNATTFIYRTYRDCPEKFFGLKVNKTLVWDDSNPQRPKISCIGNGGFNIKDQYVVSQKTISVNELPIPWADVLKKPPTEQAQYQVGIIRVLGCWGAERSSIPENNKKHEIFIPISDPSGDDWLNPDVWEIDDAVIQNFHDLADERTDEDPNLPFEPKDTIRNEHPKNDKDKTFRLKTGDLVYFDVDDNGNVTEISLSSIWRGAPKKTEGGGIAKVYDFFKAIDSEMLPMNKNRKTITLAERMFGFVENNKQFGENTDKEKALKSRIRFSDAPVESPPPEGCYYEHEVTLKILGGPKPPCPTMYFKNKNAQAAYISKISLDIRNHAPQGRKMYLHHSDNQINSQFYKTAYDEDFLRQHPNEKKKAALKQKVKITPLKKDVEFYFHIDFDNLSDAELGLLLYALRPTGEFRHKIGMGKPLGLGKVCIDIEGLFLVGRSSRYTVAGFAASRYNKVDRRLDNGTPVPLPSRYIRETSAAITNNVSAEDFKKKWRDKMNPDIRQAIELIGNPNNVQYPVHTPQTVNLDVEEESFTFFVKNDSNAVPQENKQFLKPLASSSTLLPIFEGLIPHRKRIYFLGGRDLEMQTIAELLDKRAPLSYADKGLSWGAKASDYKDMIDDCFNRHITPVLVELADDVGAETRGAIIIDHHNEKSGAAKATSLEQVFQMLGLKNKDWSPYYALVAANDRGYIAEMLKITDKIDNIRRIREADRKAQGITDEEENAAAAAVRNMRVTHDGELTIITLPHNRTPAVADRLAPELGGPGYKTLLVYTKDGAHVSVSQKGEIIQRLNARFPGGWYGGSLPNYGFWGINGRPDNIEDELIKIIDAVKNKI